VKRLLSNVVDEEPSLSIYPVVIQMLSKVAWIKLPIYSGEVRMDQQELRRLARIGAGARLAELEQERVALLRIFPGLRAASTTSTQPPRKSGGVERAAPNRRRRRRGMSPAARKAVSVRMKRYWAERRKSKGAKA
jgi:hypothetical protein